MDGTKSAPAEDEKIERLATLSNQENKAGISLWKNCGFQSVKITPTGWWVNDVIVKYVALNSTLYSPSIYIPLGLPRKSQHAKIDSIP